VNKSTKLPSDQWFDGSSHRGPNNMGYYQKLKAMQMQKLPRARKRVTFGMVCAVKTSHPHKHHSRKTINQLNHIHMENVARLA